MANVEAAADKPNVTETPWIVVALLVCPVAPAILLTFGDNVWAPLVSLSSALTVAFFDTVGGLRTSPVYVAEAVSLVLVALLGALAPATVVGASRTRWPDKAASTAALFPVWFVVMLAPVVVIFEVSRSLDPGLHRAQLSADVILLCSAAATLIALAYTIWVRRHPDAFTSRRALRKLPDGPLVTGAGRHMGIGVTA